MTDNQKDPMRLGDEKLNCENDSERKNPEQLISRASKQISNITEFQEQTTSTNSFFNAEIRINILGEPKAGQRSTDIANSATPRLMNEDLKLQEENVEVEENVTTTSNHIKEKMTTTSEAAKYNRTIRTQQTMVRKSETPTLYDSSPPPTYAESPYQSPALTNQTRCSDPEDQHYRPRYHSFLSVQIRNFFIRMVFFIIFVQLMIITSTISLVMFHEPTNSFISTKKAMFYVILILGIMVYIILICYRVSRRIFPLNFVLLVLFSIALSYICAVVTASYSTKVIVTTTGSTALVSLVVSLLACQTYFDITKWKCIISVALVIFTMFILAMIIVTIFKYSSVLWLIYSAIGTILFSVYLLYDIKSICEGRRYELSHNEYIFGALSLYADIIMIFVYLLQHSMRRKSII